MPNFKNRLESSKVRALSDCVPPRGHENDRARACFFVVKSNSSSNRQKMTKLSVLALSGAVLAEERFYVDVEYLDRRAIHAFRDFLDRELFCEGTVHLLS